MWKKVDSWIAPNQYLVANPCKKKVQNVGKVGAGNEKSKIINVEEWKSKRLMYVIKVEYRSFINW